MKTILNKIYNRKNTFTVARIAILGMLLALIMTLKYTFGFIPGIEMISFMFIFLGIFLPVVDLLLLIISFNFLIITIYGFGAWWFMYWIIWPVDAFVSKGLSKITRNRYVFGVWGFLAGFLVFFWYFWSDVFFFDFNFALLNVISAIPINIIEGLTTMVCIITIAPTMSKIFKEYSLKFWNKEEEWSFKDVKNKKLNQLMCGIVVVIAITLIILLFIYNSWFLDIKEQIVKSKMNNGLVGNKKIGNFKPTS